MEASRTAASGLSMSGVVFDIQRASLHDGPGLRTTVFLKGCHLRCAWCHNPESFKRVPETGRSGKVYGREMTVEMVMDTVLADRAYYETSGGGLTLSGGEPTVQFGFCKALLSAAKSRGIHTCLDTCGHLPTAELLELIPLVNLFHYDVKLFDSDQHKRWTTVDNHLILHNLELLVNKEAAVLLRCPIIPGVNDTPDHEAALTAMETSGSYVDVERLSYHTAGLSKYEDLGMEAPRFAVS